MTPAMYRRLLWLGIITTADFQTLFGISDDTITRAYKRGDIPPPVKMFNQNVWTIDALRNHLAQRLEAARVQAEREQAQRDAKVATLYGGLPHGERL